jgi:hypothetical protein
MEARAERPGERNVRKQRQLDRGSGYLQVGGGNAAELHPDQPAEVWVDEHQLEDARRFLSQSGGDGS